MEKRDLQKIIVSILIESKKNNIPYLTRSQIIEQVEKFKPKTENLDRKVSQALYLLSIKKKKWNEPKVLKKEYGWTVEKIK